MDSITLATVTSAVVNLAIEAGKEAASTVVKDSWERTKQWLGWDHTPSVDELPEKAAKAIDAKPEAAKAIVDELKSHDTGASSKMVSRVTITARNTIRDAHAGRDVISVQGTEQKIGQIGG